MIAVVTGGSRGIGKAIAVMLADSGAHVTICSRKAEDLDEVSNMISTRNGRCDYVVADVSNEEQVARLAAEVMNNHGKIDILVNNAGIGIYKPFIDSSLDEWDSVINTNLRGTFLCTKAFVPFMIKEGKGCIINIISGAGRTPMRNMSVYCASKFGLVGLTESMKIELRDLGISVLSLYPGFTRTSFFNDFSTDFRLPTDANEPEAVAKELLNLMAHRKPLKQLRERFINWLRNAK